jgi:D-amino peptidase
MADLKIWMMTDMEGVAGVFSFDDHASPGGRWYDLSRRLLTAEINAAIEGAFDSGVSEILVVDGHGAGGVNIDELDHRAKLLGGSPLPLPWGVDGTFDAAFIIGQHAMAGTERAHLSHTESHTAIQNVWMNGRKVGELGIVSAVAGHFGVPTILVTGDRAACAEAKAIIPQVETVAVKDGLSHGAAMSITPAEARSLIKGGARAALAKMEGIGPYRLQPPIELKVEFTEAYKSSAETLSMKSHVEKLDARTVRTEGADVLEVLSRWWY